MEAEALGPGHEVLGDQHELQPGVVAHDVDAGQVAQPGVFGGADAVLDVGAVTVAQLQGGEVGVHNNLSCHHHHHLGGGGGGVGGGGAVCLYTFQRLALYNTPVRTHTSTTTSSCQF